jgi:hypothetical protein
MRFCTSSFPTRKSLLERISETSRATAEELDTLATMHPPPHLKVTHLPRIEQATRDSIDKETRNQILRSHGVDLEFNLVSSQLAGMTYGAHLARRNQPGAKRLSPTDRPHIYRTARPSVQDVDDPRMPFLLILVVMASARRLAGDTLSASLTTQSLAAHC